MPDLAPLSLYLHVPFCTVKCAYCDFNSYAGLEGLAPAWERALVEELRRWAPAVSDRPVPTVFFGGGTPSLLTGESVARILNGVRDSYALQAEAEITLEANPESVQAERLAAYRAAGVNRVSVGVQSLDAKELHFLDRLHSAAQARAAVVLAQEAGFENVSADLIYGLPGQLMATWQRTLEGVLTWGVQHLSCYALTVEEGTPLASRVARGEVAEPDADMAAAMSEWTEQRLEAAGFGQYEISNYARPGFEARHNLVYWRQGEYVGVGPGAHGFIDTARRAFGRTATAHGREGRGATGDAAAGIRYSVERSPARYVELMRDGAAPRPSTGSFGRLRTQSGRTEAVRWALPSPAVVDVEEVTQETALADALTMGLRLNEGVDADAFRARYEPAWERVSGALAWGEREGLLEHEGARVRLTRRGRRLANEVFVRVVEPSLVG